MDTSMIVAKAAMSLILAWIMSGWQVYGCSGTAYLWMRLVGDWWWRAFRHPKVEHGGRGALEQSYQTKRVEFDGWCEEAPKRNSDCRNRRRDSCYGSRSKIFLLPGGGANRGETRIEAAMRELREETGLKPYYAKYLFRYVGKVHKSHGYGYFQDHHTVCLVKAHSTPRPRYEIKYVAFYKPGSGAHISGVTREIIEKYYSYKKKGRFGKRRMNILNRLLELFTWWFSEAANIEYLLYRVQISRLP